MDDRARGEQRRHRIEVLLCHRGCILLDDPLDVLGCGHGASLAWCGTAARLTAQSMTETLRGAENALRASPIEALRRRFVPSVLVPKQPVASVTVGGESLP